MSATKDLIGRRFHRLTVSAFAGKRKVGAQVKRFWHCRCDCGMSTTVAGGALTTSRVKSCGCLLREAITKHGGSRDPVYKVWHAMIERCRNSNDASFADYGGRGIQVCPRWQNYANFIADMGPRPNGMAIERKDVNGHYAPGNCCWATSVEQSNNRRNNRMLTHAGETWTLAQWARKTGLNKSTIINRLSGGWPLAAALSTPPDRSANQFVTTSRADRGRRPTNR